MQEAMRKTLTGVFINFFVVAFTHKVMAANLYSLDEVYTHNDPSDCWMVIDENVYDLSDYIEDHDNKLDIRSWCGTDATQDYNDKAGRGVPHSNRANEMLASYLIGALEDLPSELSDVEDSESMVDITLDYEANPRPGPKQYNILIPMFITVVLYLLSLKFMSRPKHNLLWNSMMLVGLLPSFGLGLFMILARQHPALEDFRPPDALYRHVEFSIAFGTLCVMHFLLRLNMYRVQIKSAFRRVTKQG